MDFNTYIINLESDIDNWYILKDKLINIGIHPIRFNAINGKQIAYENQLYKYDKYVSTFCKYFCPRGVLGCGLSHIILCNHILTYDINNYTLILEDDVKPLFNSKYDIIRIIRKMPKDCDILLLYCQGICYNSDDLFIKKNRSFGVGSTAAYIITKRGINKLYNKKLYTHIDIQRYYYDFLNVYIYNKQMFEVDVSTSTTSIVSKTSTFNKQISEMCKLDKMSFNRMLNYHLLRIPYFDYNIIGFHIVYVILLIIIINWSKKYYI